MGKYSHLPQLQSSQSYVGIKTAPNYLFYPHIYNSNSPFAEYVSLQEKNNSKRCWSVRGFKLECFSFPIYLLADVQVARNSAFYESLMHNLSSGCFPMHKCRQDSKIKAVTRCWTTIPLLNLVEKTHYFIFRKDVVGKKATVKLLWFLPKFQMKDVKILKASANRQKKSNFSTPSHII